VFSGMQQLTTLRELAFGGCDGCSSEDWPALCQSLASLQMLQKLHLSQVMWRTGSVWQHQFATALQRLTRLTHLHVALDKWTKEDVQQLVAGLQGSGRLRQVHLALPLASVTSDAAGELARILASLSHVNRLCLGNWVAMARQ
jgi:hypothetical protein